MLYYLVLIAVSQAGLFMMFEQWLRRRDDFSVQRYMIALGGSLLVGVALFLGAAFVLITGVEAGLVLPPLDRVASVVLLLLIAWAFFTADAAPEAAGWRRGVTLATLAVGALVALGYVLTLLGWRDLVSRIDFNLTLYGLLWAVIPTLLSALSAFIAVLSLRWLVDAPLKLMVLVVLMLGYGVTMIQTAQGDLIGGFAGAARLGQVVALILVLVILYRQVLRHLERELHEAEQHAVPAPVRQRAEHAQRNAPASPLENQSVQLLKALGMILEASEPERIPAQTVRAAQDVLRADIVGLLRLYDANYADITHAYDRARARELRSLSLNLDLQPTLVNAVERRAQRGLYLDRNVEELQDLYTRLDIDQRGPVYFQPLMRERELIAVLMVAMPYSNRELLPSEMELLKGIGIIASNLLALSYTAQEASSRAEERAILAMIEGAPQDAAVGTKSSMREDVQAKLQEARDQIAELSAQVTAVKMERDNERQRLLNLLGDSEVDLSISQRIRALNDEQEQLREERDSISRRLHEAETALAGATLTRRDQLYDDVLETLRREQVDLLVEYERLQKELSELRETSDFIIPAEIEGIMARMAEEMAEIERERDQLNQKLEGIKTQLEEMGFEGGALGFSQMLTQVMDQLSVQQARADRAEAERDALLNERLRLEIGASDEPNQEALERLDALESQLRYVADDREAAIKQRDKFRHRVADLESQLDSVKEHRAHLLARASGLEIELGEAHEEQARLRAQLQEMADERSALTGERDQLQAAYHSLKAERDRLRAQLGEGQEAGGEAEAVRALRQMVDDLTAVRDTLSRELSYSQSQLRDREERLHNLQRELHERAQHARHEGRASGDPELMMGLVQELRTPMTSVLGYIDLLLGESTGILGEAQRRFLQRVAINVERLAGMIDDLIQVAELDTGRFRLEPGRLDVLGIIEDAVTEASNRFREKELAVNLQLDEKLPELVADHDAFKQIVRQLLNNAYLVTPPNSELSITVQSRSVMMAFNGSAPTLTDCLYVAVEDRGGGINEEDAPRVFARKYRADNPLIAGLGDTGVGLSIARALVEAHGGKLWLESHAKVGSTFQFALPWMPQTHPATP